MCRLPLSKFCDGAEKMYDKRHSPSQIVLNTGIGNPQMSGGCNAMSRLIKSPPDLSSASLNHLLHVRSFGNTRQLTPSHGNSRCVNSAAADTGFNSEERKTGIL